MAAATLADNGWRVFCARHGKWLFCLGLALGAVALTYWPHGLHYFRFDRAALSSGQAWRLASAHLVHLNTSHLLLNLAGLVLIAELLWNNLRLRHGAGLLAAAAFGISGMFWILQPELMWYAGLSGVLHGLWAGCALAILLPPAGLCSAPDARSPSPGCDKDAFNRLAPRWMGLASLLLLVAKLAVEMGYGASPRLATTIGAPVLVTSHLYGAMIGGSYVAAWCGMSILRCKINRPSRFRLK